MNARIFIPITIAVFVAPLAFGQMYGGGYSQPQPPQSSSTGQQPKTTTTTTKKVMPVGVKGYLDEQMANSKDKKFHVSLNGKDLPLTPVTFHTEKKLGAGKGATAVDMKAADGKIYEIDFMTSGDQVTNAKIGKINGKGP